MKGIWGMVGNAPLLPTLHVGNYPCRVGMVFYAHHILKLSTGGAMVGNAPLLPTLPLSEFLLTCRQSRKSFNPVNHSSDIDHRRKKICGSILKLILLNDIRQQKSSKENIIMPTNLDISLLPESARVNLLDFYEFLFQKYNIEKKQNILSEPRSPGSAKGKFTVPPEFFEPLPEEILNAFEK